MPTLSGAKTRKQTRNHSNLRPKHRHTKDFLKVYYPYIPLVVITMLMLSILQPWQALFMRGQGVLPYATQMSIDGLVQETNQRRSAQSEQPLKLNAQLTKAAQIKAQDMVQRDYWSHTTPEGNAPWEFINNAGYSYAKAGENLAYGFDNEDAVVAGWMNSPGHRANMLDNNYQEVGFGFAETPNFVGEGPSTVVVAMYGQPSGAPVVTSNQAVADANSYNTKNLVAEPQDTPITRLQSWVSAPTWISYVLVAAAGAIVAIIVMKHSRQLRKTLKRGEKFVMHHPLLDVTLLAGAALVMVIVQQTGVIR